ncbi:MAG: multidrug ABC transporter permease/ATP-binding protein, partial [Campylobacterales bacterium]|nr:multidrug ABC transporter permease/ATP-binding protein [Campylobacterales bacterium]
MLSVLGKLGWFFKEHWRRYAVAIGLLIFAGFLEIIPPKMIGMAIDDIQIGAFTPERLFQYVAFLFVLAFVIYGITYVWMYQLFGSSFLVERSLRSKLMGHLLKMTPT